MSSTSQLAAFSTRKWPIATVIVALLAFAGTAAVFAYQQSLPTAFNLLPRDGQKEVRLDQPLSLTASRPVSLAAMRATFRISPAIDGQLTGSGTHFTWRPSAAWTDLTTYSVSVAGARDAAGRLAQAARWHFTTTLVPRVSALTTEAGSALGDDSEVPVGAPLKLVFNAAMDTGSVKLTANGSPLDLAWESDRRSASVDARPLKIGPVEFALAPGARDSTRHRAAGWRLKGAVVFKVSTHTVPLKAPALVQIPNDPSARDQSGLQSADMVFEYVAEGGITRMTALFTQAPDVVGPVRSGRTISFSLTRHYHGINLFSGVSAGAFGRLMANPIPTLFDTEGIYYRSHSRFPPNNLYINGSSIQRVVDQRVPPFELKHTIVPISSGEPAPSVSIPEHSSTYQFDSSTATYTKTEDGHLLGDASLSQPLRIRLLVVMHATAAPTPYVEDVNGARGLDFDIESAGRADFYYNGFKATGRWSGADHANPVSFTLDSGQAVNVPIGLTFVDVVTR